jgi:hypothetical protein
MTNDNVTHVSAKGNIFLLHAFSSAPPNRLAIYRFLDRMHHVSSLLSFRNIFVKSPIIATL